MVKKSNQFSTLQELNIFIQNNLPKTIIDDRKVEKTLREVMIQSIKEVVYDAYTPSQYKRRGINGGLLDHNLMQITEAMMQGNTFVILFENLAKGNDTLEGKYLSETIENGIKENWSRQGEWSNPRPFVKEVTTRITNNPQPLIDAVKTSFLKVGFRVR